MDGSLNNAKVDDELVLEDDSNFMLYLTDHQDNKFTAVDTKPVQQWCHDLPYKKYVRHILQIAPKYMVAMNVLSPGWN